MKKVIKFLKYGVSAIFIIIFLTLSNIYPYNEHFNFSYFNSQLNWTDSYLWVVFSITIILYILLSYDLFIKSFKAIKNKDFFNENTLMVLASIGALVIGELSEGLAVILLYKIGEEFEDYAVNRSKKEISSLVKLKSYKARIKENGEYVLKNINDIKINDKIYVFAGENVPLDIKLLSNSASIDQKALTGESLPVEKIKDDDVYSGSINLSNTIEGLVIKENKDSTISRIIKLIQESTANKSKNEKFITKFARIYTPIVIILSFLVFIVGSCIPPFSWNEWLYRAIEILVVSCPCSMVISIPISYMLSIGKSSKNGILIKGGNYLDVINKSKTIVFDKTGTLTKGELSITDYKLLNGFSDENEFLSIIYNLEKNSNHPIAKAIKNFVKEKHVKEINLNIKEIAGIKIEAYDTLNNHYEIGNKSILNEEEINKLDIDLTKTNVVVLKNNKLIGYILFEDTYKDNIKEDIKLLYKSGYKNTYILSGDNKNIVSKVANDLGIANYFSELLPEEKVEKIKLLKESDTSLTYVGDGINDAPSLALAPIGISMGKLGSDVAIQSSDVSIQDDRISKISLLKNIAKYNYFVVMTNIIVSILVKVVIMILAITGIGNLWVAIFADVGMLILCLLNSLTITISKNKKTSKKQNKTVKS